MKIESIEKYLEKHAKMKKEEALATKQLLDEIVGALDAANINRLGLWENSLVENCVPEYEPDDMKLFNGITAPACNLKYYTTAYHDEGRVFGIVAVKGVLYFVADNILEGPKIIKALDAYYNPCKWHLDFFAVIEAIRNTIKINTSNEIPENKWYISHYFTVDPYDWNLEEDFIDNLDDDSDASEGGQTDVKCDFSNSRFSDEALGDLLEEKM